MEGLESSDEHLPVHLRIRNRIPAELQKVHFLLETWHWVGLLAIIAVGLFIDKVIAISLRLFVRRWRSKREHSSLAEVSEEILRPLGSSPSALIFSRTNLLKSAGR